MKLCVAPLSMVLALSAFACAESTAPLQDDLPEVLFDAYSAPLETPDQDPGVRHLLSEVTSRLQRDHIAHRPIDDEVSSRLYESFLEQLDSQKRFLLTGDVAEFAAYRTELDDQLLARSVAFARLVYQRYMERLAEQVAWAQEIADEEFDFNATGTLRTGDSAVYPADQDEAKSRLRTWIRYQLVQLLHEGVDEAEARNRIKRRYRALERTRASWARDNKLLERYLDALAKTYDPHSQFASGNSVEQLRVSIQLSLDGIGAGLNSVDGYTMVSNVTPGGAAERAGQLKAGDTILAVAQGVDGEFVDVDETELSDVVNLIRGKSGTTVRLRVRRAVDKEIAEYAIQRARIEVADQQVTGHLHEMEYDGERYIIGVIDIPGFYADYQNGKSMTNDVARQIQRFYQAGGIHGLVIDLRQNGGGALTEAIGLTGLFIDQGPVVQVKGVDGRVRIDRDPNPGVFYPGPLTVVTSRFSASASEIFAGAMKDYGRALIVGDETTHGKGSVQQLLALDPNARYWFESRLGTLKLTQELFYRPSGDSTQRRGVRAHLVLPATSDTDEYAESGLDYALPFDQVPRADFETVNMVPQKLLDRIEALSDARVAEEEEFAEVAGKIAFATERRGRELIEFSLPLLEQRDAERKAVFGGDEEESEAKTAEEADDSDARGAATFGRDDPYELEVLRIVIDQVDTSIELGIRFPEPARPGR